MESGIITITGLDDRVRRVETAQVRTDVELDGLKQDVSEINRRLDRAARAGYFVGTSLITLAAVIVSALLTAH